MRASPPRPDSRFARPGSPAAQGAGPRGGSLVPQTIADIRRAGQRAVLARVRPSHMPAAASGAPDATVAGSDAAALKAPGRKIDIYYLRRDGEYDGWGLHVWGDAKGHTQWQEPLQPTRDGGKLKWTIELLPMQSVNNFNPWVGLQIHKGDEKDCGGGVVEVKESEASLYYVSGSIEVFKQEPALGELPVGNLRKAAAHWVDGSTLAWRVPATGAGGQPRSFQLAWSKAAALQLTGGGLQGADRLLELQPCEADISSAVRKRFPHLSGCTSLRLPEGVDTEELITGQLAAAAYEADGTAVDVTGVQLQGVLDTDFYWDGPLGASLGEAGVSISLWAPTAQQVVLQLWEGPRGGAPESLPMTKQRGVWSAQAPRAWLWKYYTYSVTVNDVWRQQVQTFEVTDPYSHSLAADGARTQIVDLADPSLAPPGWAEETPPQNPNFAHPADMSVYELHIRDFSRWDGAVPEKLRGKYAAFGADGLGAAHLRELQAAGLTHVHLLPTYDYGSVPERPEDQLEPEGDLAALPPDGEAQQAAVLAVADSDAFNWGYDPVHFSVPEGSYASDPDGVARIPEFRAMVQALHRTGLRVVLDVVYNHTFHSGVDGPNSKYAIFDKIVPGYYHRRTEAGDLCTSACCNNTAPEHAMFARLIADDIVHWARTYKVDAFRWDIMGHLMLANLEQVRTALNQLTVERDGVDGSAILHYGEAWSFGEVAHNQRGRNAAQGNLGGTGIGAFNDRFRDALMGGSPFATPQHQGWATGMGTQPSAFTQAEFSPERQRELLLEAGDLLKLSLAGLLADFELGTAAGPKRGRQLFYGPQPAGYCQQPWENVNYASCHDGETLFDQVIEKAAAEVPLEQRLRMHTLALALVAVGQGTAFFHAGCDVLRSKSLDRDSYNSGDWFNRLDWSLQTTNFGIGLPVATKNRNYWHLKQKLLADDSLRPTPAHMQAAKARFQELLRLRYSTPLLRLRTADDVTAQLRFHNTGADQVPGVVVMEVQSAEETAHTAGTVDPAYSRIFVVANARPEAFSTAWPEGAASLQLHELQQASVDDTLRQAAADADARTVSVPGRTLAVFVEPKHSP